MPFAGSDENAENRQLSEMPVFFEDGKINTDWGNQFETFFSEHFAFRSQLVTLDSLMKSELFETSSSEKVVVGKNDWLYYAETIGDYTGTNEMTGRKLCNTAKTLELLQEHFENDGRSFLFFCAPNKNSVYSENMPARYIKSEKASNRERLNSLLEERGVNCLDIVPLFRSSDHVLYQTRDSHWTNEGALLAYNAAADALGIEHDDFSGAEFHLENVWHADLDGMLFPSYERLSEQSVSDIDFTFEYRGAFNDSDDLLIKTKSDAAADGTNLLMYRDSFGRAFYPYAAQNSANAAFSRQTPYVTSLADEVNADCVILEIVERNLKNITSAAPIMDAPARALDFSASVDESDNNICEISDKKRKLRIYGVLDERYFADDSDIFVTLETDGAVYGYEAFPIYEAELLGDEDGDSDYGFSLTADKSQLIPGSYEIYAYVKNGNEYICTNSLGVFTIDEN